jgi:hypothetical protein
VSVFGQQLNSPRDFIGYSLTGGLPRRPELQVFGAIVSPLAVAMVDRFPFLQRAPQNFGHHDYVLGNLAGPARVRMARLEQVSIAIGIDIARASRCMRNTARDGRSVLLPSLVMRIAQCAGIAPPVTSIDGTGLGALSRSASTRRQGITVTTPPHVVRVAHPARPRRMSATLHRAIGGFSTRHVIGRHFDRSATARRNRWTMRLLRLRSSSLAHSTRSGCRSAGNRRKNFTTASAMTPVYMRYPLATIVAICYYSSTLKSPEALTERRGSASGQYRLLEIAAS